MKTNTIILFGILSLLTSCNGQNTTQSVSKTISDQNPTIAIGDTVSELGKSVLIIFQAANGNYWFGSDGQGVYRYIPSEKFTKSKEGFSAGSKTIVHFSTKDGLCNNRIREIKEDKSGNIYFSTQEGGISKFDGKYFTTLPVTKSIAPEKDWKLEPDDLWFKGETGKNGPYRYDGKSLYHLEFPKHHLADEYYARFPNNSWSPYEVYFIYKDSKGNIWFGTSNFGVCRYDGTSLSWLYEEHLTSIEGGGSFGIRSIIEDKKGKFWFCNTSYRYNILPGISTGQDKILISYNRETGIENLKAPDGKNMIYFMSAIEDNDGNLWMATYNQGVWRYDPSTEFPQTKHYSVKDGSKEITLFSIYKDKLGDLWLGTHEAGAYKFNGKTFEKFKP